MNNKFNIDPRTLQTEHCSKCDNITFKVVYIMKRISPILSGQTKVTFMPVEMFACDKCGNINKEFDAFSVLGDDYNANESPESSLIV